MGLLSNKTLPTIPLRIRPVLWSIVVASRAFVPTGHHRVRLTAVVNLLQLCARWICVPTANRGVRLTAAVDLLKLFARWICVPTANLGVKLTAAVHRLFQYHHALQSNATRTFIVNLTQLLRLGCARVPRKGAIKLPKIREFLTASLCKTAWLPS